MSWFAENNDENIKLILNVSKKNVYGVLTYQNNIYRIETHKDKYYITELDQTEYPNESCDNLNLKSIQNSNGESIQGSTSYFPDECKLNLLVMYTTAAKDAVSDINNLIQTAIDETNQSYTNSNVDYDCATGYYSFAHEIGHLIGARHDLYVDPVNIPFNFGHAHVNVTDEWRTIMGYNNECYDNGVNCNRINYWSNPNVDYNGDPMGVVGSANNSKVLNLEIPNAMTYTLGTDILHINQTDVNNQNVLFAGFEYTSGYVDIYPNTDKTFLGEQSITLKPGFTATSGSDFLARINPCGEEDDLGSDFKKEEFDINKYYTKLVNDLEIYPNPTFNAISTLIIKNQDFNNISIEYFNINGKKIKIQKNTYSGSNSELNFNDLPISTYYLKIYLDGNLFSNYKILKL